MIKRFLFAVAAWVVGAGQVHAAYTITDLGTLGGARSGARSINDSGQVVGLTEQQVDQHVVL